MSPRRSWLFVPGADERAQEAAARSGADVLIQELEDFTPPELRAKARALARTLYARWRAAGALAAVRVNPLETCGREDLAAVLAGKPDIVLMSKVARPEQVQALAALAHGVELVPNIESATGLVRSSRALIAAISLLTARSSTRARIACTYLASGSPSPRGARACCSASGGRKTFSSGSGWKPATPWSARASPSGGSARRSGASPRPTAGS